MRRAFYVLMLAFCLVSAASIITLIAPTAPPTIGTRDLADLTFRPHPGARLPLGTRLLDEAGRPVPLGEYFADSPVILALEYLGCISLCGVTLRNLMEALEGLPLEAGRDYAFVAISIDPREKPSDGLTARAKYASLLNRSGGTSGLHFLTAPSVREIRQIAEAVGFPYRYDSQLDAYLHPAGFVIIAPDGAISRYVDGLAISPRDLAGALADAKQGRPPGPLTRLLLFCYARAPAGRFSVPVLAALAIADIAAGLTAIGIFAAVRWRGV
ncbi:MAG: SCO family protein [Acidobacteria bacterium]|nr:SCO family protein [Acidobacteriota bacterium]